MINAIKNFYNENVVVSIYNDYDDAELCEVGFINTYNDTEILLSSINKRGEYDGYILLHVEDIIHIDVDGEYEEKIKNLYSLKKQKHEKFELSDDEIAYRLFDFAIEKNLIVRFEMQENCICGFIDKYDDNICTINLVNDYGKFDGKAVIDIDKTDTIAVDIALDQDLKLLFESRN